MSKIIAREFRECLMPAAGTSYAWPGSQVLCVVQRRVRTVLGAWKVNVYDVVRVHSTGRLRLDPAETDVVLPRQRLDDDRAVLATRGREAGWVVVEPYARYLPGALDGEKMRALWHSWVVANVRMGVLMPGVPLSERVAATIDDGSYFELRPMDDATHVDAVTLGKLADVLAGGMGGEIRGWAWEAMDAVARVKYDEQSAQLALL